MTTGVKETGDLTGAQVAFIVIIIVSGLGLSGWTAYSYLRPPPAPPNIAGDAEKYLRFRKSVPLSQPLQEILADPELFIVETQQHPLLGKPAPDFRLLDHHKNPVTLSQLVADGPVVVVFYYGYWCDHCVAQLFGIDEDIARFRELGAQVVAISADPTELTAERFEQYGEFKFPVLSDSDHAAATKYGFYEPAQGDTPEKLLHATMVIGRDGIVHWIDRGDQPFLHNKTLLHELARIEGRLPEKPTAAPNPAG